MSPSTPPKYLKKLWIINGILALSAIFITLPHQTWMLSISQSGSVKPFDWAIMPIAFVPDWRRGDYVDRRQELTYGEIAQDDLIPLPNYRDLKTDFNSLFTYITVFKWAYMDESRTVGAWSHDGTDIRAPMQTPVFSIAHGLVTKVRDDANNKYVVVEHRNVKYQGVIGKYYSSYLHLDSVAVNVGDIITKWTIIGKVGMSGITTTPHLHLQIDNENAPFYPYWPFSLEDAGNASMSFFDWVSNGLNNTIIDQYSVDAMDFVANARAVDWREVTPVSPPKASQQTEIVPHETIKKPVQESQNNNTDGSFRDISTADKYYEAITYFAKKWLLKGFDDGTFRSQQTVTRSEILWIVLNALWIVQHGEILVGIFKDVPRDHWVNPLISEAVKRKIITTDRPFFEPNSNVTRVEFLAILWQASGENLSKNITKKWKDIDQKHWSQEYAEFALKYKLLENISWDTFRPNDSVTRGEIAQAMYVYLKRVGKI